MPEWLETVIEMTLAAFIAVLFGIALGQAIDNYARSQDPSTTYYSGAKR